MSDLVTSRIFVDGEKGITAAKLNDIVASSVIQPAFYTSKPTAGTADPTDIALILKSGAYAQVPISTLGGSATQSQIWATRLRSFNAIGNPNFEVDQRVCGAVGAYPTGAQTFFQCDRWQIAKAGTGALSAQKKITKPGAVQLPGTSYYITNSVLTLTLTTTQSALGASDYVVVRQWVEGPQLRELIGDVHSISLLAASSVPLNFGVVLRDPAGAHTLTALCSIPGGNVYTLVTLPNLPVFSAGATWDTSPGVHGYYLEISLAAGSTFISPANLSWQNGAFLGAAGMDNWLSKPVNSTVSLAMIQHEPGAVCSTLMDKPFAGASGNLEECLRYYQKTYDYGAVAGTVVTPGARTFLAYQSQATAFGNNAFHKPIAKLPTVTFYDHGNGATNSVMDNAGVHHTGASANGVGSTGFYGMGFTTATTAIMPVYFHYTADSGW